MDVVDPNPRMDVADPDPCMDVVDPDLCMVLLVMVNKNLRVEKPCSTYGPTVMLTVYGLADGL
jgi:hypothetical protein